MREMSFVGEAFVVEWATFVGWAPDWEGFQCWPNSLAGARHIGRLMEGRFYLTTIKLAK